MNQILEFTRAAAPLVTVGLLIAILAVRSTVSKKTGKKSGGDYGIEGMCLGTCIDIAFGAANENYIGISLGLFGLFIGMCIHKNSEDADK